MAKTILMVDDFQADNVVMKNALHKKGFEVLEADEPSKALKLLDEANIDLMVTDFKMSGMTGAELTKAVKSKKGYKNLPVLILSSEKTMGCKNEAKASGAYGWLNKPFDINRFIKIVDSIVK